MANINIINLSGGKDSTALLLLAIQLGAENLTPVFCDTGHEHLDTYNYIDYLERALGVSVWRVKADFSRQIEHKRQVVQTKWIADGISLVTVARALEVLHPTGNPFLDMCLWKGRFPSTKFRFCTSELKALPILNQVILPTLSAGNTITQWIGVRGEESAARADLPEAEWDDPGLWIYRPLHSWSAQEVFDFHAKHNIRPNPLYTQGMSRVGCMPCIMTQKDELFEIATRFPAEIDRVREWESIVRQASRGGDSTLFPTANNRSEGGIDSEVRWSKTARGGRQMSLDKYLAATEEPQCSSAYGLCE